jgi:hypothetical protein
MSDTPEPNTEEDPVGAETSTDEVEVRQEPSEEDADDPEVALIFAAHLSGAAEDLKETLSIDEPTFRLIAPQAHRSARDYFVFEALDELQKTTVVILSTQESLSGGGVHPTEALTRIVAESIGEWLALCQRRLIETLADLICFTATPEEAYFRDYVLHATLDGALVEQHDRETFYGAASENIAHQVDDLTAAIRELEGSGLDPALAWYRYRSLPLDPTKLRRGQVLASFSRRLDKALDLAEAAERVSLGLSYGQGFGRRSASIHARPGGHQRPPTIEGAVRQIGVTATIGLSVLLLCQRILGTVPDGANKQLHDLAAGNDVPADLLRRRMRGTAELGDIVLAADQLAQVIEVAKGRSEYRSYRVRYLSRPPLPEVPEDWHPAREVRVVIDPSRARQMVAGSVHAEILEAQDDAQLMDLMAGSVADIEGAGLSLRDAILESARRPPE